MTVLSVINDVCDVVSLSQFNSVYGSDDPNAQTMLQLAQEAGEEISGRSDWQRMLRSFAVVSSPQVLPADFKRFIPGGGVRTAAGDFVRPITNGAQWAVIRAGAPVQPYYFISGGSIAFAPAAAGTDAVLDYVSKDWVIPNVGDPTDSFTADDNSTAFPERLLMKGIVWRWKREKGLSYSDEMAEFEADLVQEIQSDRGLA